MEELDIERLKQLIEDAENGGNYGNFTSYVWLMRRALLEQLSK